MPDKLQTPEEKRADELKAHVNLLLRRVDPAQAETLIKEVNAVLRPEGDARRVRMETAIASISAVLAGIIMQSPRKQRDTLQRVFAGLLAVNLSTGEMNEAIMAAAEEAGADEGAAELTTRH